MVIILFLNDRVIYGDFGGIFDDLVRSPLSNVNTGCAAMRWQRVVLAGRVGGTPLSFAG